jgi:hypothetical protein
MSKKNEEKREKKVVRRTVAIALGIICIALAATLVAAFAYYNSLFSNVTYLQEKLNDIIMSNPSAWVNKTVIVQGNLIGPFAFPVLEHSPWDFELSSGGHTIGVSLSTSVNMSVVWMLNSSAPVRIYGVVEKGEITTTGGVLPSTITYYIEAEKVEPL